MPTLETHYHELTGADTDYDAIFDAIGDAQYVLIGEASHGTHEFYRERARITRRLIEQCGFHGVAAEADWPDAYRVNTFVKGLGADTSADAALSDFARFPQWMWRNTDVLQFVTWLRAHNQQKEFIAMRAGFYGIDLYSLYASMEAVVGYLETVDPPAARQARERYSCFDHFSRDAQQYGMLSSLGLKPDCQESAIAQLVALQQAASDKLVHAGLAQSDAHFYAEQNALVVTNAERYYRTMFTGEENTWNLRDKHMAQTLSNLMNHLSKQVARPRVVVWAHNSHLGDARATDQSFRGELNLGQLVREMNPVDNVVTIGFSTYDGTVTAAHNWDEPAQHKRVRPGLRGSYEELLHEVGLPAFYMRTDAAELRKSRLQRAIGVIYRPETERQSHYYMADLPREFDWMIHIDRTQAVEPLEKGEAWHPELDPEVPEAFPSGL